LKQENVEKIKIKYNALAADVLDSLQQKAKDTVDTQTEQLIEKTKGIIAKQQESFAQISAKAPEPVQSVMQGITDNAQDAYQRAVNIIKKTSEPAP